MARIRTIKPDFFRHYDLYQLEKETGLPIRIAFAGLWTVCDREGRFKWVPPELKIACTPYDECDFSRVLHALCTRGFVVKYACNGRDFGYVPGFKTHQVINNREADSVLPDPDSDNCKINDLTREPRVPDATATREVHAQAERKEGREGKGREGETTLSGKPDLAVLKKSEAEDRKNKAVQAIEYLNDKARRNFAPTNAEGKPTANLKFAIARLADGHTLEQLKSVVDAKVAQWANNPKMCEFLRPATLFNEKNFSQYVGQVGAERPLTNDEELDLLFGAGPEDKNSEDFFDGEFEEVANA